MNEEDKKRDKISAKNYIVKKGDTLFSISRNFNLPLSLLMEYNNLNAGDIITLGQVLNVSKTFEDEPVKIDNSGIDVVKTASPSSFAPYWPINGNITKYSGRIQGVQIEGSSGDYIQAVSSGRVIWYDSFKGIGKVVLIEGDNGFDYLYGAKDDLNVHLGVKISAGEKIGRLKEENSSIIFSVFKNGKPLNDISKAPR
ncbi:LysM peptidoglycan-binding domain-containing protein [Thiospirochaeta perfilievii]|uniref:LysM peptidoglycan-binding domain-containing protein n=1 Tax=Thiospirochaeta perfilievii TaxID=252967 RepID=A0A5C1QDW2_9SPIO|nr:peptidoglycan DD-metalloendopeptidase family protein [Thiospirochaeta perfilievii]QEN05771.1 LysM peptidoglycan-binding domain-containing protein [Thiospirochaeta perfilievii]